MRLSEIRTKKYGLPEAFEGVKMKAEDVRGTFQVLRVALLREDEKGEDGEVLVSPRTGRPYDSWMAVLNIKTEDGRLGLVWTTSAPIRRLFVGCIVGADGERTEPDMINQYGREVWTVEAPEGALRFTTVKEQYGNGKMYDVLDIEEAD